MRDSSKYMDRLNELIIEGEEIAKLEKPGAYFDFIQDEDIIKLHAWLTKVINSLETIFGVNSPQYRTFRDILPKDGLKNIGHSYEIYPIVGVLSGALNDLEKGFLIGQEFLISSELFDTVLEEAKELNEKGYKDPAAVLVRVALEDSLKRIARREGLDSDKKTSVVNEDLKNKAIYNQIEWRRIQSWLDIGNAAAHGKFTEYTQVQVSEMIKGVEGFLATYLK